jgi:hypothetical protein
LLDLYGCLYFGLLFAGYYFYVSVPMGVASVALLRWIDGRNPKQKAARSSQVAAATSTRAL